MPKFSIDLQNLNLEDTDEVSETFTYLSSLRSAGGTLPSGFVTTFQASNRVLETALWELTNLLGTRKLSSLNDRQLEKLRNDLHLKDSPVLTNTVNQNIKGLKFPLIVKACVKSEATSETVSFESLVRTKDSFKQVFEAAYFSFLTKGFFEKLRGKEDLINTKISILVLEKKEAEISGQTTFNDSRISIFSQWGETSASGKFDEVELDFKTLKMQKYLLNSQENQLVIDEKTRYRTIAVSKKFQKEHKLKEKEYLEIAKVVKKLKAHFLEPVEVVFEIVNGKIFFTSLNIKKFVTKNNPNEHLMISLPLIQNLRPLIPGITSGLAKTIAKTSDLKNLRSGDIAIIDSIKKDYLPFLKKASGVVINSTTTFQKEHLAKLHDLGLTSALGKISLSAGQVITLDGKSGKVYKGAFSPFINKTLLPAVREVVEIVNPKTATKIFIHGTNLKPKEVDFANIDGVGPINPETFLTQSGIHPKHLITTASEKTLTESLQTYLENLSQALGAKPLIYQLSDFKSDQLLNLTAGTDHEEIERNPFLGKRGAERSLENPTLVQLELSLIRQLRQRNGLKDIWLSLPFVRTLRELYTLKRLIASQGLERSESFKLLLTASIPANIFLLEEMVDIGIDGIIIDYYDLACLTFGKSFSYRQLEQLEDPAIEELVEMAIVLAKKEHLFSSVVGLPLAAENDILKKCVSWGVTSLSVTSDQVENVRKLIAKEEKDLVLSRNG